MPERDSPGGDGVSAFAAILFLNESAFEAEIIVRGMFKHASREDTTIISLQRNGESRDGDQLEAVNMALLSHG